MSLFSELKEIMGDVVADDPVSASEEDHLAKALSKASVDDLLQAFNSRLEDHIVDLRAREANNFKEAFVRASTTPGYNKLVNLKTAVIGCGGIGHATVGMLAGVGNNSITVCDFDTVDWANVGPQKFSVLDAGKGLLKVNVAKMEMLRDYGIYTNGIGEKINSYRHLVELMHGAPNVVIVGTDSMALKNSIFEEIFKEIANGNEDQHYFPELLIISNMGLGDFNVYALPVKAMHKAYTGILRNTNFKHLLHKYIYYTLGSEKPYALDGDIKALNEAVENANKNIRKNVKNKEPVTDYYAIQDLKVHAAILLWDAYMQYREEAYFPQSEGAEEPCTARAINYTNQAIGCYHTCLLHWWVEHRINHFDRDMETILSFTQPDYFAKDVPFKWKKCFSTRNWENTSPTKKECLYRRKWTETKEQLDTLLFLNYWDKYPLLVSDSSEHYVALDNDVTFKNMITDLIRDKTPVDAFNDNVRQEVNKFVSHISFLLQEDINLFLKMEEGVIEKVPYSHGIHSFFSHYKTCIDGNSKQCLAEYITKFNNTKNQVSKITLAIDNEFGTVEIFTFQDITKLHIGTHIAYIDFIHDGAIKRCTKVFIPCVMLFSGAASNKMHTFPVHSIKSMDVSANTPQ